MRRTLPDATLGAAGPLDPQRYALPLPVGVHNGYPRLAAPAVAAPFAQPLLPPLPAMPPLGLNPLASLTAQHTSALASPQLPLTSPLGLSNLLGAAQSSAPYPSIEALAEAARAKLSRQSNANASDIHNANVEALTNLLSRTASQSSSSAALASRRASTLPSATPPRGTDLSAASRARTDLAYLSDPSLANPALAMGLSSTLPFSSGGSLALGMGAPSLATAFNSSIPLTLSSALPTTVPSLTFPALMDSRAVAVAALAQSRTAPQVPRFTAVPPATAVHMSSDLALTNQGAPGPGMPSLQHIRSDLDHIAGSRDTPTEHLRTSAASSSADPPAAGASSREAKTPFTAFRRAAAEESDASGAGARTRAVDLPTTALSLLPTLGGYTLPLPGPVSYSAPALVPLAPSPESLAVYQLLTSSALANSAIARATASSLRQSLLRELGRPSGQAPAAAAEGEEPREQRSPDRESDPELQELDDSKRVSRKLAAKKSGTSNGNGNGTGTGNGAADGDQLSNASGNSGGFDGANANGGAANGLNGPLNGLNGFSSSADPDLSAPFFLPYMNGSAGIDRFSPGALGAQGTTANALSASLFDSLPMSMSMPMLPLTLYSQAMTSNGLADSVLGYGVGAGMDPGLVFPSNGWPLGPPQRTGSGEDSGDQPSPNGNNDSAGTGSGSGNRKSSGSLDDMAVDPPALRLGLSSSLPLLGPTNPMLPMVPRVPLTSLPLSGLGTVPSLLNSLSLGVPLAYPTPFIDPATAAAAAVLTESFNNSNAEADGERATRKARPSANNLRTVVGVAEVVRSAKRPARRPGARVKSEAGSPPDASPDLPSANASSKPEKADGSASRNSDSNGSPTESPTSLENAVDGSSSAKPSSSSRSSSGPSPPTSSTSASSGARSSNAEEGAAPVKKVKKRKKIYSCTHCDMRFLSHTCLVRHERTHTGEKPYVCSVCHLAFRQKGTLSTHMLIHSGAQPFECAYCKAPFRHRSSVNRHVVRCVRLFDPAAAALLPASGKSTSIPAAKPAGSDPSAGPMVISISSTGTITATPANHPSDERKASAPAPAPVATKKSSTPRASEEQTKKKRQSAQSDAPESKPAKKRVKVKPSAEPALSSPREPQFLSPELPALPEPSPPSLGSPQSSGARRPMQLLSPGGASSNLVDRLLNVPSASPPNAQDMSLAMPTPMPLGDMTPLPLLPAVSPSSSPALDVSPSPLPPFNLSYPPSVSRGPSEGLSRVPSDAISAKSPASDNDSEGAVPRIRNQSVEPREEPPSDRPHNRAKVLSALQALQSAGIDLDIDFDLERFLDGEDTPQQLGAAQLDGAMPSFNLLRMMQSRGAQNKAGRSAAMLDGMRPSLGLHIKAKQNQKRLAEAASAASTEVDGPSAPADEDWTEQSPIRKQKTTNQ